LRGKEVEREERGKGGAASWLGGRALGSQHGGELHAWSSSWASLFPEFCGHQVLAMREEEGKTKEGEERRKKKRKGKKEKKEKNMENFANLKFVGRKINDNS
jgi:hypothetical protein